MPLFFNASASLHTLAQNLCTHLARPGKPVFAPHYIVTQTEGMNNWLKLEIAGRMGIAANCHFLTPSDIIYRIYFLLGGQEENVLSTNNLCWLLYQILGNKNFEQRFPLIAAYYQSSGPDKDVKRLALAEKMADLFDQYQIYRPEMMREWNQLKPLEVDKSDWQHYLWAAAKEAAKDALPDKTRVADFILNAIRNGEDNCAILKQRMPQVHLFGLSIFTEYHLHLLHELSEIIEVHFHMLNPAPGIYWFEDRSEKQLALLRQKGIDCDKLNGTLGHPLLTGWGRVLQDTYRMFFRYDAFLNAYSELEEEEPQPGSLLQKIQHDIYRAAAERHPITPECLKDGSLTINSCHTMAREVEVLYNYLVYLVDQREASLSPRDIVVMVSDVNAYGPYIRAVFDNAPYRFRYNIADATFAEGDNLLEALHAVLSISEESFLAERVMQLLELSYIRRRFGITNPTRLRYLVDAANIRFGIDGRPEDDTRFVSWRYGLKRIMYGICMSGEEGYEDHEDYFYPLDILEGSEAQDAVKFCHFAEVLMATVEKRQKLRDMAGWVAYVREALHQLVFNHEAAADEQYALLDKQLNDYNAVSQWMNEPVSYEVFSRSFLQILSRATRSGLYASGGITFCSLIPMRSIPFKVVAMLGLGFENFPRRDRNPSFNLMLKEPKPGDRSVKENDKHLFLETLLSAREYLYISYLGQSNKDNTPLPPSALVDELLDYIEQGIADEALAARCRDLLVTVHPLHGFSHRYNGAEEKLYCYRRQATAVLDFSRLKETADAAEITEIHLGELIKFFENPVKAYYNHKLHIYYKNDGKDGDNLLAETELFGLDNLQQWSFKNELLFVNDAAALEELQQKSLRTGRLPLANMASHVFSEIKELVAPVRALYDVCLEGCLPQAKPLEITLRDGWVLKGTLENVLNEKAVVVCWSRSELKYLMAAYINYLAGVAAGCIKKVEMISSAEETVYESVLMRPEAAKDALEKLVAIYQKGREELVPFCVGLAEKFLKKKPEARDEENLREVLEKWVTDYKYPCDDAYILREYENGLFESESAFVQYMALHEAIVEPALATFPGHKL